MNEQKLTRRIDRIKQELVGLGPLRPGTLYERHSVCGRPGCRCARKENPQKHGPYCYLSYTREGKSHTEFVSKRQVAEVKRQVARYGRLQELVKELVDCNIELCRAGKEPR